MCLSELASLTVVMVGLDPTIHAAGAAWILGASPRMMEERGV
jgi:hypothetical protein